jgi:hypothetical protein
MKTGKTARGFRLIEFRDLYDVPCSIQESSLATQPALWVGVDDHGTERGNRMHLDREQARWLADLLRRFADGPGQLPARHKMPVGWREMIQTKEAP